MDFKEINPEVFYAKSSIAKVDRLAIDFLKEKAAANPRKRARLCLHPDTEDALHEMIIVHARDAYVRPHRHIGKPESFHVIEGQLKVLIFDELGSVIETIEMGDLSSGKTFCYRLSEPLFHTVVPLSDFVVFHEVTKGPFCRQDCLFADWAPESL